MQSYSPLEVAELTSQNASLAAVRKKERSMGTDLSVRVCLVGEGATRVAKQTKERVRAAYEGSGFSETKC